MTAGQVVAVVALLAQMYGASAPLMECMSWHESRHDVMAINGDYEGVFQLGSEFWVQPLNDGSCQQSVARSDRVSGRIAR